MGSGTENKLRTRNKIKESVQEKHRIPVGIRNCVRIVTILTLAFGIRESPPPTPREAYLPQRPERTHKREASELRLT